MSGSEAGSLRGSVADIPIRRSSDVPTTDPLGTAGNPVFVYPGQPAALAEAHRVVQMRAPVMRTAAPRRDSAPAAEKTESQVQP
jgi:hypothetical protein